MVQERWHKPPSPSTPKGAPWSELEQLHDDLVNLASAVRALNQSLANAGGTQVIVTPSPTTGTPTPNVTTNVTIPQRGGIATGGTDTTIQMRGASWEVDIWQGWELETTENAGAGQTRICLSNTRDTITVRVKWDTNPENGTRFVLRPRYPLDNPNSGKTFQKTVAVPGVAEKLTSASVLNGFPILIVALPDNTDDIFWAFSEDDCKSATLRWDRLEPGKSVAIYVSNTDLIWIDAAIADEGVSVYVPQMVATS